ncbi:MAG: hypothetical protein AB9891_05840 [Anaerolineaceae bacterium]
MAGAERVMFGADHLSSAADPGRNLQTIQADFNGTPKSAQVMGGRARVLFQN